MSDEETIILAKAKLMGVTITAHVKVIGYTNDFYRLDAPKHLRFTEEYFLDHYALAYNFHTIGTKLKTIATR